MKELDEPQKITANEYLSYGLTNRQSALSTLKKLIERLELRLYLIGSNGANKSDYDKNETEILKIKTITEIDKLTSTQERLEVEFVTIYKHLCGKFNQVK